MSAETVVAEPFVSIADLVKRLGDIPLDRIRLCPPPGTATEADILANDDGTRPICELVDGVLVEKAMGFYESRLAIVLASLVDAFAEDHKLGIVVGADAFMRLFPGLVRIPDVSFISWNRFPGRKLPRAPIPDLAPDFAVEILSVGNTEAEMARKRREYFAAGTRLVWLVDPRRRQARVYTSPESFTVVAEDGTLDGGEILPGFRLPLRDWFARAGEVAEES